MGLQACRLSRHTVLGEQGRLGRAPGSGCPPLCADLHLLAPELDWPGAHWAAQAALDLKRSASLLFMWVQSHPDLHTLKANTSATEPSAQALGLVLFETLRDEFTSVF